MIVKKLAAKKHNP